MTKRSILKKEDKQKIHDYVLEWLAINLHVPITTPRQTIVTLYMNSKPNLKWSEVDEHFNLKPY